MRETRILQVGLGQPEDYPEDDPISYNRENILSLLDAAGKFQPDFVCFPEVALMGPARHSVPAEEIAQPIPGETTSDVGERARAIDSYVLLPTYERDDGNVYNSTALITPEGDVQGVYRKIVPTEEELERGLKPGEELPVWETEFGRIAVSICWDMKYDEIGIGYGMRDVDLMFHPTFGVGHQRLRGWGVNYGYHVAYCFPSNTWVSTPHGNVVGRSTNHPGCPHVTDFDLNGGSARFGLAVVNTDINTYSMGKISENLEAVQQDYPESIMITNLHEESVTVVESIGDDVTMDEIEREYSLTTCREAENRCRKLVHENTDESPLLTRASLLGPERGNQ